MWKVHYILRSMAFRVFFLRHNPQYEIHSNLILKHTYKCFTESDLILALTPLNPTVFHFIPRKILVMLTKSIWIQSVSGLCLGVWATSTFVTPVRPTVANADQAWYCLAWKMQIYTNKEQKLLFSGEDCGKWECRSKENIKPTPETRKLGRMKSKRFLLILNIFI